MERMRVMMLTLQDAHVLASLHEVPDSEPIERVVEVLADIGMASAA